MANDEPEAIPSPPPQVYGLAAVPIFGVAVLGLHFIRHGGVGVVLTIVAAACAIPMLIGLVMHLVDPESRQRYAAWNAAAAARKAAQEAEARAVAERRAAVSRELAEVMARNQEADRVLQDGVLAKAVADIAAYDRAHPASVAAAPSVPTEQVPAKRGKASPKTIRTKVVGVTHRNRDRTDRQRVIARYCSDGMALDLEREPRNRYDPNAVAVLAGGRQIGYLSSDLARDVAKQMDAGGRAEAVITAVTGGGDDQNYGVNIEIKLT